MRPIDADKMITEYGETNFPYNLDFCDGGDLYDWVQSQPTIETARILPPFGKTKIFWICENRLDTVANVLLPEPGIIEEEVDITMWGYDMDGNLFAVIDNDPITVGTQYLYLSFEDAQNALTTGSWKEKQNEKQ